MEVVNVHKSEDARNTVDPNKRTPFKGLGRSEVFPSVSLLIRLAQCESDAEKCLQLLIVLGRCDIEWDQTHCPRPSSDEPGVCGLKRYIGPNDVSMSTLLFSIIIA